MARRTFSTLVNYSDDPVWAPLEQIARLSRESGELPAFHEGEFMYVCRVANARKRLVIHLYKHGDTRRYLNLDEAGHAYQYMGAVPGGEPFESGGMYRAHLSLADAVERLGIWELGVPGGLYRSFPPSDWPTDAPSRIVDPSLAD